MLEEYLPPLASLVQNCGIRHAAQLSTVEWRSTERLDREGTIVWWWYSG